MLTSKPDVYTMKLILTCEHGGYQIPKTYKNYFKANESVLNTHRGYDLGALDVFNHLKPLSDFSHYSVTSRLLMELNRSLHHKDLFSEFSKKLPSTDKNQLIENYYSQYRSAVEKNIIKCIDSNETVLHISVHSFSPSLNNKERNCDIGILYDPRIQKEKMFSKYLKSTIKQIDPSLNLRFNYPYLGKMDGFTTYLRKHFKTNYIGIELEINQKFSKKNKMDESLKNCVYNAIEISLNQ